MGLHKMRQFLKLLSRFKRDQRGDFAVIFAVLAIVLIAMSGAAVDFTVIQQARTRAQVALDAAALALQPTIYTATTTTIRSNAQALLINRLADAATTWGDCATSGVKAPCASVATPTVDTTNGVLTLSATLKIPMYFVSMVGVPQVTSQIVSVSTRKKLALEVAMVLDNSGSMYYSMGYNSHVNNTLATRMDTLQSSATCAVNILFYGVSTCSASTSGLTANTNVKMGIVPFTQAVNVGSGNSSASWIDTGALAPITRQNFDSDDWDNTSDNSASTVAAVDTYSGSFNRITLMASMKDSSGTAMSWKGCVEARANPYDTDDTAPSSSTPATLYTPYFAPDEPGGADSSAGSGQTFNGESYMNSYIADTGGTCKASPTVVWTQVKTKCSNAASGSSAATNYAKSCNSGTTTTNTYLVNNWDGTTSTPSSLPTSIYNNPVNSTSDSDVYTTSGSSPNIVNQRVSTYSAPYSNREYQERMCKYSGAQMATAVNQGQVFGPNGDCPAASVLPLTATPSTVISAITAMSPVGGTNITEGSIWGWHVLSPNSPFSSKGAAYDVATSKVLIVMTDGENTIYPSSGNMNYDQYYSAYGFPWNNRLGTVSSSDTTLEAVMNTRLSTVCTNAKNAGVTIYTIGVDVADTSNPTANTTLLTNCASQATNAYFPNTAADLQTAFVTIANQLSALRLSQ